MKTYETYEELRDAVCKRTGLEVLSDQWLAANERCRVELGHHVPLITITVANHGAIYGGAAGWRIGAMETISMEDLTR